MATSGEQAVPSRWRDLVLGYPGAVGLACLCWALSVGASLHQAPTYDEPLHVASGYIYWKKSDFRFQPDNGNLSQRWEALPLLFGDYRLPDLKAKVWRDADHWEMAREFFFDESNDVERMTLSARCMNALWAAATVLLIYGWSRSLFGPAGGMCSAALFALCPTVLAHGGLATSDMASTFFFLACLGCWWRLLQRVTLAGFVLTGLCTAGLLLAKFSGVLLLPMLAVLIVMRGFTGGWRILGLIGITLAAEIVVTAAIVWTFYDFRFAAIPEDAVPGAEMPVGGWEGVLKRGGPILGAVDLARRCQVLPEGFLFGFAMVHYMTSERNAFFWGDFRLAGWWTYFPFAFAVKTPLALLALWLGAAWIWFRRTKGRIRVAARAGLYRTAPLWALFVVYWIFALTSPLNIGVRHLLPTLAPLCIWAGVWSQCSLKWRLGRGGLILLVWYVVEVAAFWPHYIAYFNQLVGGPTQGYRYLGDSSLDWGQDLPGLKSWFQEQGLEKPGGPPVYLSYFGTSDPRHYGIEAKLLPCYLDCWPRDKLLPLRAGVYCLSASNVQGIFLRFPERWNAEYQQTYEEVVGWMQSLEEADPGQRVKLLQQKVVPPWEERFEHFEHFRFARLCAYLRHRRPDDQVGYSILIYRLTDEEIGKALFGPPVELVPLSQTVFHRKSRP